MVKKLLPKRPSQLQLCLILTKKTISTNYGNDSDHNINCIFIGHFTIDLNAFVRESKNISEREAGN